MVCKIELKSIVKAYFDLSLSINEFLDRIREKDATIATAALLCTKSRVLRTMECDGAFSNFLQRSSWLNNAELQRILKAYFDESINISDFLDKIRGSNATIIKAALMCTRSCVFQALKQVQAMERTLANNTLPEIAEALSAENSGGSQPAPVRFVIEEQSLIEIFNPKFNPKVGRILIENDSAIWCGCGKDPPVAIEGTQRERTNAAMKLGERTGTMTVLAPSSSDEARGSKASGSSCHNIEKEHRRRPWIMSTPDHQSAVYGG